MGPAMIARTGDRTGGSTDDGCGDVAALVGDGLALAAEGDCVGFDSETVREQADERRRAASTHSFITCANA